MLLKDYIMKFFVKSWRQFVRSSERACGVDSIPQVIMRHLLLDPRCRQGRHVLFSQMRVQLLQFLLNTYKIPQVHNGIIRNSELLHKYLISLLGFPSPIKSYTFSLVGLSSFCTRIAFRKKKRNC